MTAMREAIEQKIEAFRYAGPLANAHEDAVAKGFTDALEWVLTLLPASTPPGDACVRHACKRVRMEMQDEIERLRGLLRRWFALGSERDDVLRGETAAEVKGDSHAG